MDNFKNTPAVRVQDLTKRYPIYDRPSDRLRQFFSRDSLHREFWALKGVSFEVKKGEVLGIIGKNGSGKSTLLQLVCGTLTPTSGSVDVQGRVAALLELGAGFNPEFTGRENVILSAAILGLTRDETEDRFDEIVEFSGIGEFIDQPVKTYSSGMYVRLAFSVATSVDPDILVIDEALSVGDGEFARKSFDRIMKLKESGKTILFCSHSLYQVEAICDQAIWLDRGEIRARGNAGDVVYSYNNSISIEPHQNGKSLPTSAPKGHARLSAIEVTVDGRKGTALEAMSGKSDVKFTISFVSDPELPCPSVAAGFMSSDNRVMSSACTYFDQIQVRRMEDGSGSIALTFTSLPLLRGNYWATVYLMCENCIHVYDHADYIAEIRVTQDTLEQGVVSLPHGWG